MLHVHPIDSWELPGLAPYRTMKRDVEHQRERIFVAEGEKVVRRLLLSRFEVVSLLLPEPWLRSLRPLVEARSEEIHAYVAEKKLLEQLTGYSMYQGVLAVGRIPSPAPLQSILRASRRPWLLVAVDGLTNAENMGVVVRNCAAFGVQALVVGETCSSPFLRRAVRSSMGTIFELPVEEVANLSQTLGDLGRQDVRIVAAHPPAELRAINQVDFTNDCCVVFGSEGYGISPLVLEACPEAAAIPMCRGVDSLNVGSAAAVLLYEISRQRTGRN